MATSGELIKTVAEITGHPEARVVTYFRSLREAGLVTKSGRGPSAAKMTPRDAATLLTALMGSRFDNEPAAQIVRDFETVKATHGAYRLVEPSQAEFAWMDHERVFPQGCLVFDRLSVPELQSLPDGHTITDALAGIIDALISDTLGKAAESLGRDGAAYMIEVWFYGPQPKAGLNIQLTGGGFIYEEDATYLLAERRSDMEMPDFEIRRRITWRTLKAVADIIAGKAE